MKTYLLLRNNRQSGPFSLAELLVEGLRPQDLVWVEGQSSSWRYPAELDELKAHVPLPVLEAVLDLGFVEVQNRIVPQRTPMETIPTGFLESPGFDIGTSPDPLPVQRILADLPHLPAASVLNDEAVPAFDALAGLLPDDDLMPTMAWQSGSEKNTKEKPLDRNAGLESGNSLEGLPSGGVPSKVKVLLPAALPDKTMVVIRRRDHEGQPVSEPRVRPRRPVLEFLAEEAEFAPEVRHAPVTVEQLETDKLSVEQPGPIGDLTPQPADNASLEIAVPFLVQTEIAETVADIHPHQYEPYASEYQPGITEKSIADILPVVSGNVDTVQVSAAPTLQVNISLVQKIAVITAIVSLVAVAILLANSIFNPNAYQYGTKPASAVSKQVSPAGSRDTVKP